MLATCVVAAENSSARKKISSIVKLAQKHKASKLSAAPEQHEEKTEASRLATEDVSQAIGFFAREHPREPVAAFLVTRVDSSCKIGPKSHGACDRRQERTHSYSRSVGEAALKVIRVFSKKKAFLTF